MKKIKEKLNKKGFTLTETLFAILIVALSGLVILGALSVSMSSYKTITRDTNARMHQQEYLSSIREGFLTSSNKYSEELDEINEKFSLPNPVIYVEKYKSFGYYDTSTNGNYLVFKLVSIDGNTLAECGEKQLIAERTSLYGTNSEDNLSSTITYTVNNGVMKGEITTKSQNGDVNITRQISITNTETMM